jgi:type IV pilus assembly protein PilC
MLRSNCPISALVLWCRTLRHGLDIGLSPIRIFRQLAKSGPAALRVVAERTADRLGEGNSLSDSLKPDAWRFPNLFIELVAVGEKAGRLPAVFGDLETHYEAVQSARTKFLGSLVYPAFVYVSAIVVITLLIAVLGAMSNPITGKAMDPLGLGLVGMAGAIQFLFVMGVLTVGVIGTIVIGSRNVELRAKLEGWALQVPGLRECVRAFALERFSLAASMTLEAGMKANAVMKSSFQATANTAYRRQMAPAVKAVKDGDEFAEALAGAGPTLFPEEYLHAITVGEESGRLVEVLAKQAAIYREEAIRRMNWLAKIASAIVYLGVATLVIYCIFKLAMTLVIGPTNDAIQMADDPQAWLRGGR